LTIAIFLFADEFFGLLNGGTKRSAILVLIADGIDRGWGSSFAKARAFAAIYAFAILFVSFAKTVAVLVFCAHILVVVARKRYKNKNTNK
jgi:hypothetical protein